MVRAMPPPACDAIVVLGCRVLASGRLSAEARARTEAAAAAYFAGQGRFVVASGGRRWGPHAESIRMKARRAGVVTSDWHMRRALANFEALGVEAVPFPSRGPRHSFFQRAALFVNERLSGRLDRARQLRSDLLRESAARLSIAEIAA